MPLAIKQGLFAREDPQDLRSECTSLQFIAGKGSIMAKH